MNTNNNILGVWHRPNSSKKEHDLEGIIAVLEDFKSSGINLIFLETLYHGMSIWKNLFRAEIIRKNNLVFQSEREILSEDSLFMLDYISCIKRAIGIEDAFYHYFRNSNSISKSYKKDRFEKTLVFVNEVEARFKKDIPPEEYRVYVCRFWQAMCRVICCQELVHAADQKVKYTEVKKRLREICTHPMTVKALKSYPLSTLPIKQRIFAYGMKYRMYFLLKILVVLRSK